MGHEIRDRDCCFCRRRGGHRHLERRVHRGAAKPCETVYADKFASCHAPDLSGLDQAPALTGGEFMANWNDLSMHDLFERVRISMPAGQNRQPRSAAGRDVLAFTRRKTACRLDRLSGGECADADPLKALKILANNP